eukprot:TRINITY_DN19036_c0_g1_i1.p1 TRINITY_DN19036_c0_g1~~TRINITY_DN19036_c0_g1_i1.p1  ORF type:complete len:565 (+),score=109.12 TRINITY_DN19036_c0_g1_i1:41-1735(+)
MGNCSSDQQPPVSRKKTRPVLPKTRSEMAILDPPKNKAKKEFEVEVSIHGKCEEWKKAVHTYKMMMKNKLSHDSRIDEAKANEADFDANEILECHHQGVKNESLTCHKHIDSLARSVTTDMIVSSLWNALHKQIGAEMICELVEVTHRNGDFKRTTMSREGSTYDGLLNRSRRHSLIVSEVGDTSINPDPYFGDQAESEGTESPLDVTSKSKQSADMFSAATNGEDHIIRQLHSNGASVTIKNGWGTTPIHYAATNGHSSTVELLVTLGADVNKKAVGSTPLHLAAVNGQTDCCETLIRLGADIHATTTDGHTPLHKASMFGNVEVMTMLLKEGASIDTRAVDGSTPVHTAAKALNAEALRMLHEAGADLNVTNKAGASAIHLVAKKGSAECVFFLHSVGANIHALDEAGSTALHYAARFGFADACQALLFLGVDANAADKAGYTALKYALKAGEKEVAFVIQNSNQGQVFDPTPKKPMKPRARRNSANSFGGNSFGRASELAQTYSQRRNSFGGSMPRNRSLSNGHQRGRRGSRDSATGFPRRNSRDSATGLNMRTFAQAGRP